MRITGEEGFVSTRGAKNKRNGFNIMLKYRVLTLGRRDLSYEIQLHISFYINLILCYILLSILYILCIIELCNILHLTFRIRLHVFNYI